MSINELINLLGLLVMILFEIHRIHNNWLQCQMSSKDDCSKIVILFSNNILRDSR